MKFDARFRLTNFVANFYLAPISEKGLIAAWRGQHAQWRSGFVLRVLWLGFVVRWGYVKRKARTYFDNEEFWEFSFLDEEPH